MNTPSDETTAKRRKVRKGTHSCWECRQRKVKCVFSSPGDTTCTTCHRRGTKCVSQVDLSGLERTQHRASYAEQLVASDTERASRGSVGYSSSTSSSPAPASNLRGSSVHDGGNKRHGKRFEKSSSVRNTSDFPPTPASNLASIATPTSHEEITQVLLRALPCHKDTRILLEKFNGLAGFRHQFNLKARGSTPKGIARKQDLLTNMLHPESHPVLLARQMLSFVTALQLLGPNAAVPGLTENHHVIMQKLAASAIKMVSTNDALLGTLEGLEIIVLESLYHTDSGNIRRAWVTMRRAVMAAQLLGLHRPGHYRFKVVDEQSETDPAATWTFIVATERMLSLLLGLPTSTDTTGPTVQGSTSASPQCCDMVALTTSVTAKIIERNKITDCQQALDMTRKINGELINMSEQLPSSFWRPLTLAGLEVDSVDAFSETRRAWDHMFYYTLVNQIHLPYMLCPDLASPMPYSRIACVNASREVLTREIAVRTWNPSPGCCRMADFMALIAGMTLILAHVVDHCPKGTDHLLAHQRLADRATVERALECMKSIPELREDVLTERCAALLKDLLAIEADAAQGHDYSAHYSQWGNGEGEEKGGQEAESDHKMLIIKVPYIGVVKIAREGVSSIPSVGTEPDRGALEGVTIGGIGSIHFENPRLPDRRPGHDNSDVAAPPAPQQAEVSSTSQHVLAGDYIVQQDQMFPDAAASMDDWVFQGFDTAFFDILMRGNGEQQPGGSSTEGWELGALP